MPDLPSAASAPALQSAAAVLVIGAGLAGLSCARALTSAGFQVTVVDKGRGPGGRISTRRTETASFDHGAQYFTVRDPRFAAEVAAWEARDVAAEWSAPIVALSGGTVTPKVEPLRRLVGVPGMSALTRHLASHLEVRCNHRVLGVRESPPGLVAEIENGAPIGPFSSVIVSVPGPQAGPLLAAAPALRERISRVPFAGCWAIMVSFERPLGLPFGGAFVHDSALSWIADDGSKPGRASGERWVLHASAEWSDAHLDEPADSVLPPLLSAFAEALGRELPPLGFAAAHRWRHAIPTSPLAERCLFDAQHQLGVCGDAFGGPRVEGAFLSGLAMADRLTSGVHIR